jgi:hypothetical protein
VRLPVPPGTWFIPEKEPFMAFPAHPWSQSIRRAGTRILLFAAVAVGCVGGSNCRHLPAQTRGDRARVELELITEKGFPVTGQQEWLAFLRRLDLDDLRIRSGRAGEAADIETRQLGSTTTYRVTGLLTSSNQLRVPGGTFRHGDRTGIQQWIEKVRGGGKENVYARHSAFGLNEKQLVDLHEQLAAPLPFKTRGESTMEIVRRISGVLPVRVTVEPAARGAFTGQQRVADELQGISGGTALAAVVRPLGLVVVPRSESGNQVVLRVVGVADAEQSWPVGWPSPKSAGQTMPKLFRKLNVEIADTPLVEAVEALQKRLEVPILYDYNSLARRDIDLAEVRVSLQPENIYYKEILDRLLRQARLNSEVRVDEGGRPLLWISAR